MNTVSIPVGELKPAIAGLAKIINTRSQLEAACCVQVEASQSGISLLGTDLSIHGRVFLREAQTNGETRFLVPFQQLQSVVRRLQPQTIVRIDPCGVHYDLGTGAVSEEFNTPDLAAFPEEPKILGQSVRLPENFPARFTEAMGCSSSDSSRAILNGVFLDTEGGNGHYLVGSDGRHLFSANSFTLPVSESFVIPAHKIFSWRGLAGEWAISTMKGKDGILVRLAVGDWTITAQTIEGQFPKWRQVVPESHQTVVTLPPLHTYNEILRGFPVGNERDNPIDLVVERGIVSLRSTEGNSSAALAGAKAEGPDATIRVNRDYLAKAFAYGLTRIGLNDSLSPLHFSNEGRQMIVMPIHHAATNPPSNKTAPVEPQQETSTPMTAIQPREAAVPHINGSQTVPINGNGCHIAPVPTNSKPPLEAAIDNLDAFRSHLREALSGLSEITSLLRQAVRDQKTNEREIHSVRQTLRSLQNVRI